MKEKIGVVDVGGGFRGVYAAGVLDYCMDQGIWFDLGVGVSAGSANMASYCARQPRRNLKFHSEYGMRKAYMSAGNFLRTGSYLGLEYIYGTLTNSDGENPLDYPAMVENPMQMLVVATQAETGKPWYFTKEDMRQDRYQPLMASSAIPLVCKPCVIDGVPYYDGALSDPVPVEKAFSMGCDKVVVLLTRPEDVVRDPKKDKPLARGVRKKYPMAAQALELRAHRYNQGVERAKQYARQGKALIVAPDDTCGVSTLCRDAQAIHRLYEKGYADGQKISSFLSRG